MPAEGAIAGAGHASQRPSQKVDFLNVRGAKLVKNFKFQKKSVEI
jgi:hypothetical protein